MIKKGTWVTLRSTILEPKDRAANIPEDTAKTPLIMWVSGFLDEDCSLGNEASIITKAGRLEKGVLEEANPSPKVDYGDFVPEILAIGSAARALLFENAGGDN